MMTFTDEEEEEDDACLSDREVFPAAVGEGLVADVIPFIKKWCV